MELGNGRNHEAIVKIDHKLDETLAQMQEEMSQMREELGTQLQQFMLMFTCQNSVSMAPEFPPRDRTEPLLRNNRTI